ncbi:DUF262 domain-containing protein [Pedobacter sp. 22226]|uniref:DUF262 domain-containing protein n=1 Tax=Pedobacter sp. 22226 TaxID=3453894 RepID=UPI003F82982C
MLNPELEEHSCSNRFDEVITDLSVLDIAPLPHDTQLQSDKYKRITPEVITLRSLLFDQKLRIPNYQRPYKWSLKNVNDLLNDILLFKDKPAYRLGTIVYHQNDSIEETTTVNDIVDGQQRTITLLLIALAIQNNDTLQEKLKNAGLNIPQLDLTNKLSFKNNLSKNNIRENYREIQRRIVDFDAETIGFFYDRCEVVKVVLSDISEAFQFFDSQNARGVDLNPHDLLKAFHLREMVDHTSEKERIGIVEGWENMELKKLKRTFSNYLFRIRNWNNGNSARRFTKNDISIFKGISPNIQEPYPFANIYRISHFYVDGYNKDFNRNIDHRELSYPFQLDQVVINGKRFFEMIAHYVKTINELKITVEKEGIAKDILKVLDTYDGRFRTGDKYVRNLFDCALMYYIDKFGKVEIERAIERIFIWAYTVRLTQHAVQLATVDNYALQNPQIFKTIKNALQPNDFFSVKIKALNTVVDSEKTKNIKNLFLKLQYIYE